MPDNNTLIAVSAFSGLAGALLTQTLTGFFAYISDKRKSGTDLKNQLRNKQIEIAEAYYFMTGETMAQVKKNINYWTNRNRSDASFAYLQKEIKKLDARLEQLNTENWKHNLVSLYFQVSLSLDEILDTNTRTHALYLKTLDIADQLNKAKKEEQELLLGQYNLAIFDLCGQYELLYQMLEQDMQKVKTALLHSFKTT
ncbi:hypothetical protein [Mucilaginibacter sp. SG564]|uniref:hypothetical protein n=1 Tax=unclassified Mucilaginibacter TaxID=2617802 RepID=UPI001555D2D1|nr:hypothetical protein [Mucilaginibacter sp. SG564]NOW98752.1 hypothetical protein [Mucilaginibacter sp. SG564]